MQLIGMLDSPYVRRVAVSLRLLGLRFEHRPVSVFRGFEAFRAINPVVKAPTLVCDDGLVLMDSTLILEYAEALARPRTLVPAEPAALARSLRLTGLALALCEKTAQAVYERHLRPPEKVHGAWLRRVGAQRLAACAALDAELRAAPLDLAEGRIGQAAVSAAVAWTFTRLMLADETPPADFPALAAHAAAAEALPAFVAAPCDENATVRA